MGDETDWVASGRNFDIDRWYDAVQGLTPKTFFLELSPQQMEAMLAFYRLEFWPKASEEANLDDLRSTLRGLRASVQAVMDAHPDVPSWFVRLSSRSPKDGAQPLSGADLRGLCQSRGVDFDALREADEAETAVDAEAANALLCDLMQLQSSLLQVASASAALRLLCTSERVYRDLIKCKEHNFTSRIALREFDPRINDGWEFRCFLCSGKLTAISQYNPYVFYSHLQGREEFVEAAVEAFLERHGDVFTQGALGYDRCVLDVCLVPAAGAVSTAEAAKVVVIEFNPFDRFTSPALFDWKVDEALLRDGPPEVRFHLRPPPQAPRWAAMWLQQFEEQASKVRLASLFEDVGSNGMPLSRTAVRGCALQ